MSTHGIPMVRLNAADTEVDEAVLRLVTRPDRGPHSFEMQVGGQMPFHEVANLIRTRGDTVRIATANADNLWSLGEHVRVRPGGPAERIESVDDEGTPTRSLLDLPKFI